MSCAERALVDAHFAGTIAPADERRLRAHLDGCEACRARYRQRQLLGQMDPQALVAEERLRRGLGIARPRKRASLLPLVAAAIAFAALLAFALRPKEEREPRVPAEAGQPDVQP